MAASQGAVSRRPAELICTLPFFFVCVCVSPPLLSPLYIYVMLILLSSLPLSLTHSLLSSLSTYTQTQTDTFSSVPFFIFSRSLPLSHCLLPLFFFLGIGTARFWSHFFILLVFLYLHYTAHRLDLSYFLFSSSLHSFLPLLCIIMFMVLCLFWYSSPYSLSLAFLLF